MRNKFEKSYQEMIKDYLSNPDKYVFPFVIKEDSGKERTIITYREDTNGRHLRADHTFLADFLKDCYISNKHSFAYKNGYCCLDALKDHLKSSFFIKLDIKSFFESITEEKFMQLHGDLFEKVRVDNKNKAYNDLRSAFYKGHLSLGYITSPIISDIYLSSFDQKIEKFINERKGLHYSRYCDDMLISYEGDNWTDLEILFEKIKEELMNFNLLINEKKTKRIELDFKTHNSISFLGLNISRIDERKNKVTISKHFILFTIDLLRKYYKNSKSGGLYLRNNILSRIAYLKNNSPISYNRFLKKHRHSFNKEYVGI